MKSTTSLALFLLCALTSSYQPSATADIVFDTEGNPIRNGGTYYVLPVIRGKGGGIEFAKTETETCPLTVVQSPFEGLQRGLPLIISSPFKILDITEGLILSLKFHLCTPLSLNSFSVDRYSQGSARRTPCQTHWLQKHNRCWFRIQRASSESNYYKLVFCTSNDDSSCGDIVAPIDREGNRPLIVTHDQNHPLLVQFQKVEAYESSTA
uniref:Kunitz trypsin inhibitor n=1 Tax=Glycine max TaxID=3847 RepID=Q39869_SOYBN|nr:Kunitz trypsin inhibitor [Glycine max]